MFVREHTPRNARVPTLEASNQVQINDLVQRNRALEQAIKNLEDQLNSEQRRAKEALTEIQEQLRREQREWREGCDALISCHRLAHLRTLSDLETVKTKVLQEQEVTREEKEQRLQRDIRILKFQAREGELEDRIAELEDEKEDILAKCGEVIVTLRRELSVLAIERKTMSAQMLALKKEKDQIQDELSQLREGHATLRTSAESSTIKLERVELQFEGARTKNTELERFIDELKRTNDGLQRQLEKWQTLETKGVTEIEAVRKQKMELEVKLSTLQDRTQRQVAEKEKELERMTKREEKMKEIVQQWQGEAEEEKIAREKTGTALTDAYKRIKLLEMELRASSIKSDEGYVTTHSVKPNQSKKNPSAGAHNASVADLPSSSGKAARKPKTTLSPVVEAEMDEVSDASTVRAAPGRPSNKSKKTSTIDKGKAKAISVEPEIDDPDRSAPKSKRRRKISSDNDEDNVEVDPRPVKKAKERTRVDVVDTKGKSRRGTRQTGSKVKNRNSPDATAEDEDSGTEQAPAKKMRKINIFSKPAEPTFAFMGDDIGIGLDIPTTLSPVKGTTGIPNRSTSASVMSKLSKTFSKR
ncbi:hypothetical protein AX14_009771 [Amanita brunnescens Koide BX004]|nr:hypothetical protein AX14_006180 [Amanita brunnescens Koide BX004]KAF8739399.1 hypothetical protein AX14_009771 [Amanita brunnescens Koide BX004]